MQTEIPSNTSDRFLCDILRNMRQAYETRNFSYLPGLIEEAQYRAERMENAIEKIGGWGGVQEMEEKRISLKTEIKELEAELKKLKQEKREQNAEQEKADD
jgi:50S ribosomal subunit-associated GTPase HflX